MRRWHTRRSSKTELPEVDGRRAVTFHELVELMCIRGFRHAGVRWHLIRQAASTAARVFNTLHPFAVRQFFADPAGVHALLEETTGAETLVELSGDAQYVLESLIRPYLGQLDFDPQQVAQRWWPLGREARVSIDPRIAFGRPVVADTGIPVETLTASIAAEAGDIGRVAWLYGVQSRDLDAAVRFQEWLTAA